MVGTFADVVVADAIVKGVPGFDLALAKDALMKDVSPAAVCISLVSSNVHICVGNYSMLLQSFDEPPPISGGSMGKVGLRTYTERGFVPTTSGRPSLLYSL